MLITLITNLVFPINVWIQKFREISKNLVFFALEEPGKLFRVKVFPNMRLGRFFLKHHIFLIGAFTFLFLVLGQAAITHPRSVTVRVERSLIVQQNSGQVTFQSRGTSRPVVRGDRLQAVGDGVATGSRSAAELLVDTGIGFIQVSENTQVRVRAMGFAPDNGRTTSLEVPYGQVRLQLRRFTHPGSYLEIHTPAGVSAVRGTTFGITVQSDGKTGLATLSGAVISTARGKSVLVRGGFQNFVIPGKPPSPPVPLKDNTDLKYEIKPLIHAGIRSVQIAGQVDPVNIVLVEGKPQVTDPNGRFSVPLPALSTQTLEVTVITPLGRRQVHKLFIRL